MADVRIENWNLMVCPNGHEYGVKDAEGICPVCQEFNDGEYCHGKDEEFCEDDETTSGVTRVEYSGPVKVFQEVPDEQKYWVVHECGNCGNSFALGNGESPYGSPVCPICESEVESDSGEFISRANAS